MNFRSENSQLSATTEKSGVTKCLLCIFNNVFVPPRYFSLLHVLDLCSMLYSLLNSKHIITMSRKHNTNTKIRIILKLEKRVMIMNSSMFLLTYVTHLFHWFSKRGDIDKRWEWFKKKGAGNFIRTMFFHSFDPSTTIVVIIIKTSQLTCTAEQLTVFYMMEYWSLKI